MPVTGHMRFETLLAKEGYARRRKTTGYAGGLLLCCVIDVASKSI